MKKKIIDRKKLKLISDIINVEANKLKYITATIEGEKMSNKAQNDFNLSKRKMMRVEKRMMHVGMNNINLMKPLQNS